MSKTIRKSIKLKLTITFLLLSCKMLFGNIALDTIMQLTFLSPDSFKLSGNPITMYTDNQWSSVQSVMIGSMDKYRVDRPLAKNPDFEQVTAIMFTGWPATVDSVVQDAGTVTIGYDVYQNPVKVYYHLTNYYEYVFPPPPPHPVDEIKVCTMPKTTNTVLFFRNILHTDAAPPSFINQPMSWTLGVGNNISALSGQARAYDGGTLSYQWYSNTTASNAGGAAIEGETNSWLNVSTDVVGTFYYYVVVTNTNESVSGSKTATVVSDVATIKIIDPLSAVSPTRGITATGAQFVRITGSTLKVSLADRGKVEIYALNGAKVRKLDMGAGTHALRLNNLPRGTYVVSAESGAWRQSVRMVVR